MLRKAAEMSLPDPDWNALTDDEAQDCLVRVGSLMAADPAVLHHDVSRTVKGGFRCYHTLLSLPMP